MEIEKYINKIILGDCIEVMKKLPANSVDLIFADPPYNLQLQNELYRPNQTKVDGVFDDWDKFNSIKDYDNFTRSWLTECRRILKDNGTIWVIGSYHNIYRVGAIMQELGFWFLNDIIWIKSNPMPNFKGTRFNNAHETLIWAAKHKNSKYTFHYKAMKVYNDDKQLRSDWYIPICSGSERLKINGKKVHSTQKPEELLYRIIISTSNVGDIILDPFLGSGTTAAVAKKLQRKYIGIEKNPFYVEQAKKRIANIIPIDVKYLHYKVEEKPPRVPFGALIEKELIKVGEKLYSKNGKHIAVVLANASIELLEPYHKIGSIHQISASLLNKLSNNGWKFWFVKRNNKLISIDEIRKNYIETFHKTKPKYYTNSII